MPSRTRKGRGGLRVPGDPLKSFTRLVALPSLLVYVGVCALVFATLHLMTGELNRIDADRGRKAVSAAIGSIPQQLGEQVRDEATWTEAYLNTYSNLNPAWLDSTWGETARNDGHYDAVVITDAAGSILFGESSRGPLTGKISDHYSGAAEIARMLADSISQYGDDSTAANIARTPVGVTAVAAAVIHGAAGQVSVAAGDRRLLWLAKGIDGDLLGSLARRFEVPTPRLASERPAGRGDSELPLSDATGQIVDGLVWQPLRPGDAAFIHAAGVASLVLLVVGALLYIVLHAFRRNVERRAVSEKRDWIGVRYDAATGLLNRRGLEESLGRLVPRRGELSLAVACIEFEGLKDVAASYGHEKADALLARLADLIEIGIDDGAQIARRGPEEFVICCTGGDALPSTRRIARMVLEILAEAIPLDDLRLKLGASIGLAEAHVTAANTPDAFAMAATAMHVARETGGNHVIEYDASIEERRRARLALQADIRGGLDRGEFEVEYQPVFDTAAQRMLGVEALLRWPRRPGGPMSPAEFIPAAEASGLIEELGLFALRRACEDMVGFDGLKLSVNVSTVQFRSPALASRIDAILASTRFPPSMLQLEITESFLLAQPGRAKTAIEELRRRGISIALDDFGSGFSSVGFLRQFSFDRVKIDRSLVMDIDIDPVKLALVESTMVVAYAMGLALTAEGVERHEEARTLTRIGCHEFQGYLFSPPLSIEAFGRLAAQQTATVARRAG
ncbi:MAG: bifunctional diguanylate cyclase/phosphodiesterase [Candidatus Promineifilaceae bacterium]